MFSHDCLSTEIDGQPLRNVVDEWNEMRLILADLVSSVRVNGQVDEEAIEDAYRLLMKPRIIGPITTKYMKYSNKRMVRIWWRLLYQLKSLGRSIQSGRTSESRNV